jgi:hypothetical protein
MRAFQLLYRTASGGTNLTGAIVCANEHVALAYTTEFVRQNLLGIYEIENPSHTGIPWAI